MVIPINDVKIIENGLSQGQFMLLLTLYLKIDIDTIDTTCLLENGYLGNKYKIDPDTEKLTEHGVFITNKGKDIINDILLNSNKDIKPADTLQDLAKAMQDLFPKGKKYGTNYYWRDSTSIIVKKLQIFFKRYGDVQHEQVLEATKRYVESFEDNTTFMQLLKYFIWKNKPDGSEESMLLSYIENDDEDVPKNNWTDNLV